MVCPARLAPILPDTTSIRIGHWPVPFLALPGMATPRTEHGAPLVLDTVSPQLPQPPPAAKAATKIMVAAMNFERR